MVYYSFLYYLLVYVPYFCCWGNMYDLLNPPAHWRSLQIRKPNNLRSDSPRYRTPAPSNISALSFSNITNTHLPFCTQPTKKTLPDITNKPFCLFFSTSVISVNCHAKTYTFSQTGTSSFMFHPTSNASQYWSTVQLTWCLRTLDLKQD